jgi:hypothetical protein
MKTVAKSTGEAEYMALSNGTQEIVWIRHLLQELNLLNEEPTIVNCDNQTAIRQSQNPMDRTRMKHIDIAYHFVRHRQEEKEIEVKYVPSEENIADPFTKPLPVGLFRKLRENLGLKLRGSVGTMSNLEAKKC